MAVSASFEPAPPPFMDERGQRKMIANWNVTEEAALHEELRRSKTLAEARNIELEAARERIERIASHDHLTGLPNRRYLDRMLDQRSRECRANGSMLAILHIDLDRFKQINDTLGQRAGDVMLKHTAEVLANNVGQNWREHGHGARSPQRELLEARR
jgi:PleD family two-component response regulator